MTEQQSSNSFTYKQIRSLSCKLRGHIIGNTVESDSRQPRKVKHIGDLIGRLEQLFGFDPTATRHRIIYCVLKVTGPIDEAEVYWHDDVFITGEINSFILDAIERVYHNINGLLNLLYIYGYEFHPEDLGKLWNKLLWFDLGNEMEEYLKFQSSSYLAKMLKQDIYAEMPQSTKFDPEFFLVGRMNKFLRRKLFSRDLNFGWSVCQLKRGMSPLRGISVIENLRKHKLLLSNRRLTPDYLLREVTRTTREVCSVKDYEFKIQRPSPAACYENKRQEQGCIRAICGNIDADDDEYNSYSFGLLSFPHTQKFYFDGVETEERVYLLDNDFIDTLSHSEYQDIYWSNDDSCLFSTESRDPELEVFAEIDSRQVFTDIENRVHSHEGPVPATVVALSEPFKTRIITKSMADANYYAKPLQQAMHSTLRRNKIFTALDRPLVLEDFVDMCNIKAGNPTWNFVSGDYSAATDNLNSDATLTSLFQVMESLMIQTKTRVVLAKAVANQEIHYCGALNNYALHPDIHMLLEHFTPNVIGAHRLLERNQCALDEYYCPTTFVQTNGQLMGSILSFPLLCMINAAVFRYAAEFYHEEVTGQRINLLMGECEKKYGLRVNGDDILFIAPQRLIDIWSELVATIGLELSIGKNYVHPTVFTINSQMFEVKGNMVIEHNYVNLGLYNIEQNDFSFWRTCDKVQQRLYKGHLGERLLRMHEVLMYSWSPALIRLSNTLKCTPNWYFPRHLGGLGLQTFEPVIATEFQKRVATALMTRSTIDDILKCKFTYSERNIDPVLEHQLSRWKALVKKIGYEFADSCFEEEDPLLGSLMSRYSMDYVTYDVEAKERSLMKDMTRRWNKFNHLCGGLKTASIEKILFDTPRTIKLKPHQFELTEYTTSYPRCRYDIFDATTDEFPMECDRNPEILDPGFDDFWTSMGYQRIPEDGALAHH